MRLTQKRSNKAQRGFSLLELLVVISIIGILIAMGAVAFSTAQRKGREGRRRADIRQMQNAFEQYFADNSTYAVCGLMAVSPYMPGGIPEDPKSGVPYYCAGDANGYCACGPLEELGTGNASAPSGTSCNYGTGNYFCVSNLQ